MRKINCALISLFFITCSSLSFEEWQKIKKEKGVEEAGVYHVLTTLSIAGIIFPWIIFLALYDCEEKGGLVEKPKTKIITKRVDGIKKEVITRILYTDSQDRPHNLKGHASLEEGKKAYYIHGARVDKKLIQSIKKGELKVAEILREGNQEVKRALIEHYGRTNFFKDCDFKVKHSDDFGDLCSVDMGEEACYFVKVINGTENENGSFDTYFLQVPGDMDTAKEAVAWTYGMSVEEYDNVLRT